MFLKVKHASKTVDVQLRADDTVSDLQNRLHDLFHIPPQKQKLFFARGGRTPAQTTKLRDMLDLNITDAASPTTPVALLLIGTPETRLAPQDQPASTAATAQASAVSAAPAAAASGGPLVAINHETKDGLYMCSYPAGYAAQDSYVCQTCIKSGAASPEHVLCHACSEVCHAGHDVECFGLREFMRCDCCTVKCWVNRELVTDPAAFAAHACKFIVNASTGNPPMQRQPANSKNIYPRSLTWCYCAWETPDGPAGTCAQPPVEPAPCCTDGAEADMGSVCILCCTCYWSPHLTRLHTSHLSGMQCYGEVCSGTVVAYRCNTCSTLVCPPCRLNCHKDHDVDVAPVYPSDGEDNNGAPDDCEFSCGCRGGCPFPMRPRGPKQTPL